MKIHSVRFAGVGPFRDEQSVDFDSLSGAGMFLLEGPTGVGKSTIIDVIVFALYGRAAAEDGDNGRLVSQFRNPDDPAPYAEMVFSTARGTFRVRRTPVYLRPRARAVSGEDLRKENATGTLTRLTAPDDPDGTVVASRVTELGGAINEVVGLTREQFVSTIVLPQGEFARFLRSGTDDKRKILQSIFRTHLFQKVQDRLKAAGIAAERQCAVADAALQTALDTLRGAAGEEHAGALADLVPGTESEAMRDRVAGIIDTVAERAEAADDARAAAESAYRGAAAQLAAVDSRIELRDTLAAATEQSAALQARAAEIAAQQEALRDDDRAGRVADALATADRLEAASRAAADAVDAARRAAPADIARADPQDLQQRSHSARQLLGTLEGVLLLESELPAKTDRHSGLEREAAALRRRTAGLLADLAQVPSQLQAARRALADQQALAAQAPRIAEAIGAARGRAEAAGVLASLHVDRVRAEAAVAEALADSASADAHLAGLTAAYRAGIAATIGAALLPGQPCPACGSCEHPAPAAPTEGHVTGEVIDAAAEATAAARDRVSAATAELASLDQRIAAATASCEGLTLEQSAEQLSELEQQSALTQAAQDAVPATQHRILELEQQQDRLTEGVREAEQRAAATDAAARALADQVEESRARIAQAAAGFPSVAARASHLDGEARSCEALVSLHQRAASAAAAADDGIASRDTALAREGFGDASAARGALLPQQRRTELSESVRTHAAAVARVQAVLDRADLRGVDAHEEIDRAPAAAALAAAEDLRNERIAALTNATGLLERVRARAAVLDIAIDERAAVHASRRSAIALGNYAKGRNRLEMDLATFVLVRRFASVIEAANHHLTDMSNGRLSLESFEETSGAERKGGLGIRVFDHHTEQSRSAKTLSGGETFFTSLSLALGLAEIVTAECGGVALDTLFVDEGFGSLDQETLDNVMAVLEDLRSDGRVLGLVSHVTEMKERIPERIEVRRAKDNGPSELRIVA